MGFVHNDNVLVSFPIILYKFMGLNGVGIFPIDTTLWNEVGTECAKKYTKKESRNANLRVDIQSYMFSK